MTDWRQLIVRLEDTVRDTMAAINRGSAQIALVVNDQGHLVGVATDGDVRRGILSGISLEQSVEVIMQKKPFVASVGTSRENIRQMMIEHGLRQIPVIDNRGQPHGLFHSDRNLRDESKESPIVILAGGLGTRLYPLTQQCPKPMLKIGSKPILETILEGFVKEGFRNFYFAVNYKAQQIKSYFGDGKNWNASITYLQETKRLGTAGPLGLLSEEFDHPIIVINGDILTKVNFSALLAFHAALDSSMTVCVREHKVEVPFGVIKSEHFRIKHFIEKPVERYLVNAGIYVLSQNILSLIPRGEYFDMPELIDQALSKDMPVSSFPIQDYWIDVGRHGDYERASKEYSSNFGNEDRQMPISIIREHTPSTTRCA